MLSSNSLDRNMRSLIKKKDSQQSEEYDLNDIDHETKQLRPSTETGPKNGISRNYCFNQKNHSSRNESKMSCWYFRKQKMDASTMEMETFTTLNNTKDDDFYSNAGEPCGLKRMCRISKKTELHLGRFMLIFTIISLVGMTNLGSLSIYVPSIIQKHHSGHTEALSRKRILNDSQENEVTSSVQDNLLRLNETNPSEEKINDSRGLKVSITLIVELTSNIISLNIVI